MLMAQTGITPTSKYKAVGHENNETASSLKQRWRGGVNAVSQYKSTCMDKEGEKKDYMDVNMEEVGVGGSSSLPSSLIGI